MDWRTLFPFPSPSPRACSNSCPLTRWCHPTILSSAAPLLFLPSILPSIRVFSDEVGSSQFSPVSHSVVSDSLQPHGPQHARFPSPSPTPGKHQVAKVLELQLQHQSFQWIFGLISFKIDWFDLLAAQGAFQNLPYHHSLKGSILWHSAFYILSSTHNHTWPLGRP